MRVHRPKGAQIFHIKHAVLNAVKFHRLFRFNGKSLRAGEPAFTHQVIRQFLVGFFKVGGFKDGRVQLRRGALKLDKIHIIIFGKVRKDVLDIDLGFIISVCVLDMHNNRRAWQSLKNFFNLAEFLRDNKIIRIELCHGKWSGRNPGASRRCQAHRLTALRHSFRDSCCLLPISQTRAGKHQ